MSASYGHLACTCAQTVGGVANPSSGHRVGPRVCTSGLVSPHQSVAADGLIVLHVGGYLRSVPSRNVSPSPTAYTAHSSETKPFATAKISTHTNRDFSHTHPPSLTKMSCTTAPAATFNFFAAAPAAPHAFSLLAAPQSPRDTHATYEDLRQVLRASSAGGRKRTCSEPSKARAFKSLFGM